MKMQLNKIAFVVALGLALCFAQEAPERLAVYTSGASEAGVNKSLSNKLLATMVHSGIYSEISDPGSFQDELIKSGKSDLAYVSQTAKRYGADYVCTVNMVEAFGAYSISARLIKIAGSQVVKTGLADRSLKSLDDLTAVSNELAMQLLPPSVAAHIPHKVTAPTMAAPVIVAPVAVAPPRQPQPPKVNPPVINSTAPYAFLASGSFEQTPQPSAAPAAALPAAVSPAPAIDNSVVVDRVAAAQAAAKKQCAKTYNVNEILYNLKEGFPTQLKDCSTELAKDMAMSFIPGKKKPEPKSFMQQCALNGIRNEIPDGFPNADNIVGSVDNFVQGLLNSALAGGAVDPKKLLTAVSNMNIENLLSDVKKLASGPCVVNEPYVPTDEYANRYNKDEGERYSDRENEESAISFGIRTGFNFSHAYGEYDIYNNIGGGDYGSIIGVQFGFVLDFATSDWFHIQPGFMYIKKGMEFNGETTAHYIEFPLLFSLKLSALRLDAGPYIGLCLSSSDGIFDGFDVGVSAGLGFDLGMFYIGTFYDYGLVNMSNRFGYNFYNRTLGFNLGVNL
jgi:hypothetical protein